MSKSVWLHTHTHTYTGDIHMQPRVFKKTTLRMIAFNWDGESWVPSE